MSSLSFCAASSIRALAYFSALYAMTAASTPAGIWLKLRVTRRPSKVLNQKSELPEAQGFGSIFESSISAIMDCRC